MNRLDFEVKRSKVKVMSRPDMVKYSEEYVQTVPGRVLYIVYRDGNQSTGLLAYMG